MLSLGKSNHASFPIPYSSTSIISNLIGLEIKDVLSFIPRRIEVLSGEHVCEWPDAIKKPSRMKVNPLELFSEMALFFALHPSFPNLNFAVLFIVPLRPRKVFYKLLNGNDCSLVFFFRPFDVIWAILSQFCREPPSPTYNSTENSLRLVIFFCISPSLFKLFCSPRRSASTGTSAWSLSRAKLFLSSSVLPRAFCFEIISGGLLIERLVLICFPHLYPLIFCVLVLPGTKLFSTSCFCTSFFVFWKWLFVGFNKSQDNFFCLSFQLSISCLQWGRTEVHESRISVPACLLAWIFSFLLFLYFSLTWGTAVVHRDVECIIWSGGVCKFCIYL